MLTYGEGSPFFYIFKKNVYIFNIFVYVTNFRPLNIKKMCKIMVYIMPHEKKIDVINVILGISHHLYITQSPRGKGGKPKVYLC